MKGESNMSIEKLIQLPKQSLDYLYHKIIDSFPFIKKIRQTICMNTAQYEAIYPYVAHQLYQALPFTPYDSTLIHFSEGIMEDFYDSQGIKLDGFYILEHNTGKTHVFLFTYEGTWLYNNESFNVPTHIQEYINKLVCNSHECLIYNKLLIKENLFMNNIERLQMEIAGIDLPHEELIVYLEENGLRGYDEYNASKGSKKAIYESAVSVLHSIANQPHLMKNYKQDDMSVDSFAKYLQSRINQLEGKIRQMPNHDSTNTNFFNLFQ